MTYPTPPPNEGWCAPGTCGGRWSRVVNGIFETFPLPPGVTVVNVSSGVVGTSSTAGSPWDINDPSDEIKKLRTRNAALEAIEYGSPNPDEARAALERAREVARVHPHADTCATELSPNAGYPCSCWRGDLIVALTVPVEVEAI